MSEIEQLDDLDGPTAEIITRLAIIDIQDTSPAPPIPPRSGPARRVAFFEQQAQTAREVYRVELLRYREVRGFSNVDFANAPELSSDEATDDHIQEVVKRVLPRARVCAACGDEHLQDEMLTASCGHRYCGDCLESLYRASMKDETLFPPRCHGAPFSFDHASRLLSPELRAEFSAKREELEDKNKLYCSKQTCSAYLPVGDREGRIAACQKCCTATCTDCRARYHGGACPRDEETEAVLSMAQQEGWRRCNSCNTMVELNTGCNHMTCRCRHEFCYLCGATWKTCDCAHFDEDRLLERAQIIVDREAGDGDVGDAPAMAENLREQHECVHQRMAHVEGRFVCEGCDDTLTRFIFRCNRCHTQLCYRCRYHRT